LTFEARLSFTWEQVMSASVIAVGRPEVPAIAMPDRFRHEIAYFAAPHAAGEYSLSLRELREVLDDGCVTIVSPLDSDTRSEIELAEDHERWLEWVLQHAVERVRFGAA
jgi:hypothetical protein